MNEPSVHSLDIETDNSDVNTKTKTNIINEEYFNEDLIESEIVLNKVLNLKPYFSVNTLPSTQYLEKTVLPLVYEALSQVEKVRPMDPIEFFSAYILEKNKKQK